MRSFEEYWNEHGDVYGMEIAENAWDYQQSKVDELTLQVAEMKSRLNDAYTDGQSAMYAARQSKVDELQKQKSLQELEINQIAHANQQWQLKCGELQKRIDGIKKIIREAYESDGNSSVEIVFDEVEQLEQALKGGGE